MTEEEWLKIDNPLCMLDSLIPGGHVSERKLRLIACACARQLLLRRRSSAGLVAPDAITRLRTTKIAELFADGKVTTEELQAASQVPDEPTTQWIVAYHDVRYAARTLIDHTYYGVAHKEGISILRELLGNPFEPSPTGIAKPWNIPWLGWNDDTVPKIAQRIYTQRTFEELPILADAIEEAGCPEMVLIEHLRSPTQHYLGCWALDAVLGLTAR